MNFLLSSLYLVLTICSAAAVASKLFFLAGGRMGSVMMLSNVLYETLHKKFGWTRMPIDAWTLVSLSFMWVLSAGAGAGFLFALAFSGAWAYALDTDIRLRTNDPGLQEEKLKGWVPLPNPRLILNIRGPILQRGAPHQLGDWPIGHVAHFELLILNPTVLPPQYALQIEIDCAAGRLALNRKFPPSIKAPMPGEYVLAAFELKALQVCDDPVNVQVKAAVGSFQITETLQMNSIFDGSVHPIISADINRWRGGATAGFAWRGDMDLYDPGTFQSVEGMRMILAMARRYRVPSTLFVSGRLCLVQEEHRAFCEKLGVDRRTEEIADFIEFMKNNVDMTLAVDFPFNTDKPYALEIGNHMYLHYGTHAAMAEGNDWKMRSWMGAGHYDWQSGEAGSIAEQRDNAVHNARVIKEKLGVAVKTWGVPGRVYDKDTSKAVEASGMEVGSDTNASAFTNVFKFPPPHHPEGCERLVELTKKYPGDPDNAYKVAMLKYWIAKAVRERKAFIYMTHHHALRYQGIACLNMTEEILRHVIQDHRGKFHISTLYGLGTYWDRVLCPAHRWVNAVVRGGTAIDVANSGHEVLENIPVEVAFEGGKKMLVLADLPQKQVTTITFGEIGQTPGHDLPAARNTASVSTSAA